MNKGREIGILTKIGRMRARYARSGYGFVIFRKSIDAQKIDVEHNTFVLKNEGDIKTAITKSLKWKCHSRRLFTINCTNRDMNQMGSQVDFLS